MANTLFTLEWVQGLGPRGLLQPLTVSFMFSFATATQLSVS
jgi:hypothetical protein